MTEAVKARSDADEWNRLKEIFTDKSLQMISLYDHKVDMRVDGNYFPFIRKILKMDRKPVSAMVLSAPR